MVFCFSHVFQKYLSDSSTYRPLRNSRTQVSLSHPWECTVHIAPGRCGHRHKSSYVDSAKMISRGSATSRNRAREPSAPPELEHEHELIVHQSDVPSNVEWHEICPTQTHGAARVEATLPRAFLPEQSNLSAPHRGARRSHAWCGHFLLENERGWSLRMYGISQQWELSCASKWRWPLGPHSTACITDIVAQNASSNSGARDTWRQRNNWLCLWRQRKGLCWKCLEIKDQTVTWCDNTLYPMCVFPLTGQLEPTKTENVQHRHSAD